MESNSEEYTDNEDLDQIKGKCAVDIIPEMRRDWLQFEILNKLKEPTTELLRQRWYRQKFRLFSNKWLRDRWIIPPQPLGNEDFVFSLYPDIEIDWKVRKEFLKKHEPSDALLMERWKRTQMHSFQKRWLQKNTSEKRDQMKEDSKIESEVASFCHLRKRFKFWFFSFNNIAVIEFLFFLCGVIVTKKLYEK